MGHTPPHTTREIISISQHGKRIQTPFSKGVFKRSYLTTYQMPFLIEQKLDQYQVKIMQESLSKQST